MEKKMLENEIENVAAAQLEDAQTEGAGMHSSTKKAFKTRFSSKRLALMAVFVAISFVVSLWETPALPLFGTNFLKLDFGNVFIVLISFLLGPIEGVLVCLLKEGMRCFSSPTMCVGELGNFIITSSYLLLPSILYQYRRNLKTVIWSLLVACLIATGAALLTNRFILLPLYKKMEFPIMLGMTVGEAFAIFWPAILIFNLLKTFLIGFLTMLLYKRLSNFIKKMKI